MDELKVNKIVDEFFGGRNAIDKADARALAQRVASVVLHDINTGLEKMLHESYLKE